MNTTGRKFGGRKKGTPNKTTSEIKEVINQIVSDNLENLQIWIDEVAKENPKESLKIMLDLIEYTTPKLSRVTAEFEPTQQQNLIDLLFPPESELIGENEIN